MVTLQYGCLTTPIKKVWVSFWWDMVFLWVLLDRSCSNTWCHKGRYYTLIFVKWLGNTFIIFHVWTILISFDVKGAQAKKVMENKRALKEVTSRNLLSYHCKLHVTLGPFSCFWQPIWILNEQNKFPLFIHGQIPKKAIMNF